MSNTITVERKITLQTFGVTNAEVQTKPIQIMRIIGFVDYYKIEAGVFGDYAVIFGDFLAMAPDGRCVLSAKLIFPMFLFEQFFFEQLLSVLDSAMARIEIGLEIGARPSEKSKTGYEWVLTPLFEPKPEDDPLLVLANKTLALEAPTFIRASK